MTKTLQLFSAVLLVSQAYGQPNHQPENSRELSKLELTQRQLLGMKLCGHTVDTATYIDARESNASSTEEAIEFRWLNKAPGTPVHTAIVTAEARCVVSDGALVDGKIIATIMPNSLAVSSAHALTAYEAEYWNAPAEKGRIVHRGAFIEDRFLFEIDPRRASTETLGEADFRWRDSDEALIPRPGVVMAEQAVPIRPETKTRIPALQPSARPQNAAPPALPQIKIATTQNFKLALKIPKLPCLKPCPVPKQ